MRISDWSADVCSSDLDKFARMAGAKFSGPLGGGGASWELGGEWTDTYAWELTTGDRQPGIVYRNFIYFDGFTYRDRPIGNSIDTDSELLSFDAAVTDTANRRYYGRSEEHTSELQSLMRISYAVFCLKKKKQINHISRRT